jgi:RNA polymerase sigma factor (sigma-70 family)
MRNLFRDRCRTERSRRRSVAALGACVDAAPPEVPGHEAEPRRWDGMDIERVYASFATLPTEQRAVLELHTRHGLKYGEIARRLQIPGATVGTRLHRARHHLRTLLAEAAL